MAYRRDTITLSAAGSSGAKQRIGGGPFDWFCLSSVTGQPNLPSLGGSGALGFPLVALYDTPDSNTDTSTIYPGDVIEQRYVYADFENPFPVAITFDILRGTGRFHRNFNVLGFDTPQQAFFTERSKTYTSDVTTGWGGAAGTTAIVAIGANVRGILILSATCYAQGDGATAGLCYLQPYQPGILQGSRILTALSGIPVSGFSSAVLQKEMFIPYATWRLDAFASNPNCFGSVTYRIL